MPLLERSDGYIDLASDFKTSVLWIFRHVFEAAKSFFLMEKNV